MVKRAVSRCKRSCYDWTNDRMNLWGLMAMYRTKIFHSTSRDVLIAGNNQYWKSLHDVFDRIFYSIVSDCFSRAILLFFLLAKKLKDVLGNLNLAIISKTWDLQRLCAVNQFVRRSKEHRCRKGERRSRTMSSSTWRTLIVIIGNGSLAPA